MTPLTVEIEKNFKEKEKLFFDEQLLQRDVDAALHDISVNLVNIMITTEAEYEENFTRTVDYDLQLGLLYTSVRLGYKEFFNSLSNDSSELILRVFNEDRFQDNLERSFVNEIRAHIDHFTIPNLKLELPIFKIEVLTFDERDNIVRLDVSIGGYELVTPLTVEEYSKKYSA